MRIKPWVFLTVSTITLACALFASTAFQARQDELRELERECEMQLQQVIEIKDQLDEASDRLTELEEMLLNLQRTEQIVSGTLPSRGGHQYTATTMPILSPSGFSPARFERAFAGTALAGIGEALVEAERETGINALVLAGIIAHETGWGTSALARDKNNMAGLGAYDGREYSAGMAFATREESVMFLARLIARKPCGTLDEIGAWYATDPCWAAKVAGCVKRIVEAER